MKLQLMTLTAAVALVTSCGQSNPHRHHEKQRTSSDIKISSLDLENKKLQLRFEYRSYVEKTLEKIDCEVEFNKNPTFKMNQQSNMKLGAFSTEILSFNVSAINQADLLMNLSTINYDITCEINYDKGTEYISGSSVLHLSPSEQFIYR